MRFSRIIASLLLSCAAAPALPSRVNAAVPPGWSTNLTAALNEAGEGGKPALVYFTATWCGPCKLMARTTLIDPSVRSALSNAAPVIIDIDVHPDTAAAYDVRAVPTFVFLSPGGSPALRTTGYQDAEKFREWVTNGIVQTAEATARLKRLEELSGTVTNLLAQGTASASAEAAKLLFELCGDRDEAVARPAVARLKSIATDHPAILLEGLNHSRLATRIQVANTLREQIGDAFDIDPWSGRAERAEAVERWRERLAISGKTRE